MNKKIYIRADSSSTIGTGHIMRCLVLANRYKDSDIIFGTKKLDGDINHKIIEAGYELDILKSNKLKELLKHLKLHKIDMLIIDHYKIDYRFEKKIKKELNIKILSLDDNYQKHHCDILLNHNIYAKKKRYKNLLPDKCKIWCGQKYTLLRDEFMVKYKKKNRDKKMRIFVSMGGSDDKNITIKILKTIKSFKNKKVIIATTSANKNIEKLQSYIDTKKWVKLKIDSKKIAKHMLNSDFAIITPSVIANEAYHIGIPFIAIRVAKNQDNMYRFLKHNGFFVLKKMNKKKLFNNLKSIIRLIAPQKQPT